MPENSTLCDVFISHAAGDAKLARELVDARRANGVEAFTAMDLPLGADIADSIWEALAESRAMLFVLSSSGLTPSMAIELGAAQVWNKPLFAILTDAASPHLPIALAGRQIYTPGRIDEIIRDVNRAGQDLTDADRTTLAELNHSLDSPVDLYAANPVRLEKLVRRFRAATGKAASGERLLSEMLRLYKQGQARRREARQATQGDRVIRFISRHSAPPPPRGTSR